MQFTTVLLAVAALAVSAQAAQITNSVFGTINVGSSFNITWGSATGPVTLKLKNGPATNQNLVSTIATGLSSPAGSFVWQVPTTLPNGLYNFEIDDNGAPNYSEQFTIAGSSASSSASGSSTASSTSTSTATTTGSSVTTSTSTASSSTSTPFSNSTTTRASSTTGSRTGSATSSTAAATQTGAAVQLASPFALILTAFMAFAYLN